MKRKWITRVLPFLLAVCLSAGCRADNIQQAGTYEKDLESGSEGTEKNDKKDFRENASSVLDGNWYVFDTVKREGEDIPQVTFEAGILKDILTKQERKELAGYYGKLQSEGYWEIPYEYDEENQILTLDYNKRFQIWENILQEMREELPGKSGEDEQELWNGGGSLEMFLQERKVEETQAELDIIKKEFPGGLAEYYVPMYDDMMFVYLMYPDKETANKYLQYDNVHFPNSTILLEKKGKYCALKGAYARKAEFPNARSMPLSLGCETVEGCLCKYYAGWAGVFSRGCLETEYGIQEGSLDSVSGRTGREYNPKLVDDDNLRLENVEDVPREDKVWKMYEGCPLEEVKYVTYSYDADGGRKTGGVYLGKTYGLWSVVWVEKL